VRRATPLVTNTNMRMGFVIARLIA
jgi:hypothetical protein